MAFCKFLLNDGTSHILLNDGISVLLMNDNSCSDVVVVTPTPTVGGGTGGARAWSNWYRSKYPKSLAKKKRTLLDDLDEALAELREKIVEVEAEPIYTEPEWSVELRRGQALAESALAADFAYSAIQAEITRLLAVIQEIDDEEAVILTFH